MLNAPAPGDKVALSRQALRLFAGRAAAAWRHDNGPLPPSRPARPEAPKLLSPGAMPKRGKGARLQGRIALIHALTHIELNAIDLAWDLLARFARIDLPGAFYDDWLRIAAEEALHFSLLEKRLGTLGSHYGALPAHDGLWQAATDTADDLLARLAVVPLVLEARGLDVTPTMISRLKAAGDPQSAAILERIYADEIGHVSCGRRWFEHCCGVRGLPPARTWRGLVEKYFRGRLKPPFNHQARRLAGFDSRYYALSDAADDNRPKGVTTKNGRR